MAPQATATTRRVAAHQEAPGARPAPSGERRPPLRLFQPAPRRRLGTPRRQRSILWVAGLVVAGSLLAVVVGDTLLAEGQVRLTALQSEVAAATTTQKAEQVAVAEKAAPPVVVSQAKAQGLVIPTQVVSLPQVPLNVRLPVPQTTGSGRSAPATTAPTTATTAPTTR